MEALSTYAVLTEKHSVVSKVSVSHIQLACTPHNCSFPLHGTELCIWNTEDPLQQPLHLLGHHEPITAVTFGQKKEPLLVCSASEDYVIIWSVNECRNKAIQGLLPRGIIIGTLLGPASYLSFSPDDLLVALCSCEKIYVLSSQRESIIAVLEGHLDLVTAAEFCSWKDNVLVSVSEDRTFKIWDHIKGLLMYQSGMLSASPLISLCISEKSKQFVTGSVDGQIWVFSLVDGHQYRNVLHVDLQKKEQSYCNKNIPEMLDVLQVGSLTVSESDIKCNQKTEIAASVLRIVSCEQNSEFSGTLNCSSHENSDFYWICTITGIFLFNSATSELDAVLHFGVNSAIYFSDYDHLTIQIAGSGTLGIQWPDKVFCVLTSMFGNQISLLEVDAKVLTRIFQHQHCVKVADGVVASSPLLPTSPLRFEFVKKETKPAGQKKSGRNTAVKDHPLVFQSKVKSSCYTAQPRRNMFVPHTNVKKHAELPAKRRDNSCRGIVHMYSYPEQNSAPVQAKVQISAADRPGPVNCLKYSGDGKQIACGLADKSILVYNSSLDGSPSLYSGHDAAVTCVDWSFDKKWIMSASEDASLRIWATQNGEPLLILGKEKFHKPIRSAQFYFMDKFILMSSGSDIQLLAYYLDIKKDDLKRYKQTSRCKLVQTFRMTSSLEITSITAVNDFYSYIVVAAGSNRALEVFDMNSGCSIAMVSDAHSRAVHQVCQNKGSAFCSQPPEAYNLFLTTAVTDGIKLWDMRTMRCVRRYEGHLNRSLSCRINISSCGRFIATGSEDRCAYIYDINSSTYIHKLTGHKDSVVSVAFSPAEPKLWEKHIVKANTLASKMAKK
ncbi:WD repeat-containing protein 27 [Protopterus annectens]|uniref:WD repeat-containing protein 27 n=1 Tax=Protopterus annectens TaxID=7888 RepID=UPI001CFC39DB|nr:WD repeat-containing protein 27 [Protopterus annectens]